MAQPCTDTVMLEHWHPVVSLDELRGAGRCRTVLLDRPVEIVRAAGGARVLCDSAPVQTLVQYGYVWASFGTAPAPLFPFPEFDEADRRFVVTGVFGVQVSAGRAIENFLDMGHFPYVHTGILGEEPHTEVKEYDVEISQSRDEILATRCRFYQPKAAVSSDEGADVEYIYRVPHPNCSVLYKSSPVDETRLDAIYIFVQPMGQEKIRAHTGMCIIDDASTDLDIRSFQQTIFGQDKPILENQYPRRLPLDPRAETPIRADKSAIAYRRWLAAKGLGWGVIPAGA
ncbi:aromatic ring-hydroxylating dioxygenase subunit alpha [Pseudooceanicola sediminis]|uniref:Aromatic ring-hydroxylating dioxygenase subunit alpha n=2 Tax=Pseudooceanicola sediminis TaxID=2211117 RepID=A0A399J0Z9_9RHOB|nr:aromatic ring-hydroxylating dioxygenase subunit alpha [Puniceibacterium sp. HSS470]RII39045.1 aromatic ring-hydroxylating dioxygenase subunit alpha [Pseudooceanicola sediminis]